MTIEEIYREFQGLHSVVEKIQYLRDLKQFNLPYYINYDGLIAAWTREL